MKATWQGRTIAESDDTVEMHGYLYFPRESVKMDMLSLAEKTESDLECPHGVQFYDVGDGRTQSERAAWSYERPTVDMKKIDHWVAFWEDVNLE
jgi:uncharacterized protein (DUF427 family)